MRRLICLMIFAVGLSVGVAAQEVPVDVSVDASAFRYTEEQSLVEVYLGFSADSLPFAATDDGYISHLPVEIALRPIADAAPAGAATEPIVSRTLDLRFVLQDTSAIQTGQVFVEQVRMVIAPGEYSIDVQVQGDDATNRPAVRLLRDIIVPSFHAGSSISSVQVAQSIERAGDNANDSFTKSGLSIRPNPSALYGEGASVVPYYAEVYGMKKRTSGETYTLLTYLTEAGSEVALENTSRRTERASRPVDVLVGQYDTSELPSGIYFLHIAALNEENEAVAEQAKKLYINNPSVERPEIVGGQEDGLYALYNVMEVEELDRNIAHAELVATSAERSRLENLETEEEKRAFLIRFWRERDVDNSPRVNEARRDFYQRINLVNERFSEPGIDWGYQTERGRVFLIYGAPSEVDRRRFEQNTIPHEVWYYDNIPGEGQSLFVFADRYRSSRFELIHSDVTGEVTLPNWEREIVQ